MNKRLISLALATLLLAMAAFPAVSLGETWHACAHQQWQRAQPAPNPQHQLGSPYQHSLWGQGNPQRLYRPNLGGSGLWRIPRLCDGALPHLRRARAQAHHEARAQAHRQARPGCGDFPEENFCGLCLYQPYRAGAAQHPVDTCTCAGRPQGLRPHPGLSPK